MSDEAIQCDPKRLCGVPTVGRFRFSVAQLLAEVADGRGIVEIADHFDLPPQLCTDAVKEIATSWAREGGPQGEIIALRSEALRLRAQLPDGMKNCTIRFKSCPVGHGRLTADNWIDHGCDCCEMKKLQGEIEALKATVAKRDTEIAGLREVLRGVMPTLRRAAGESAGAKYDE